MSEKKKDPYRQTLQLPKTKFSMRANLLQMEPKFQKRWDQMKIYERMRATDHPLGKFVFHDGPPYANGTIHLGHLFNKVLKDLVVRSRIMEGYDVEFVPGWDCHGLPIEHKVMKDLGEKAKTLVTPQIRARCKSSAEKFIKIQSRQMQRLGTLGTYKDPYLTMNPRFEGAVLEVFADLVEVGLVYRALKPVHWSITNETALAEAELEYYDKKDKSVYVNFEIKSSSSLPVDLKAPRSQKISCMIWTTTPWTLPANRGIAVAPLGNYCLCEIEKEGETDFSILVDELKERVCEKAGAKLVRVLGTCTGQMLGDAKLEYLHPFTDYVGKIVVAEYVTFEDGTGLVHTAPGHGADDYVTGKREGLEVYCPVQADGTYDSTVPDWIQGKSIWDANQIVTDHLRESGHLFFDYDFNHSYPHDWRSKTPTIFRATYQWFIGVDLPYGKEQKTLRQRAEEASNNEIKFIPDWGKKRLLGMLESRPDWCISRQRSWGLPIPAFMSKDEKSLLTAESVRVVAKHTRKKGSDFWFKAEPKDLLEGYDPKNDSEAPKWVKQNWPEVLDELRKSSDIFDVWFESGSSWNAVLKERNIGYPAELYLEGSDQHRGWFQLSLLPALGATGEPPFKTLLTHGFIVTAKGHKMSKSIGNTLEVDELLQKYGADICRWWVSSLNYTNDVKVDWNFFQLASEEYRKVRNTIRFLIGNLNDFDPKKDRYEIDGKDSHSMDAWAQDELRKFIIDVTDAYQKYQYKKVQETIFNFCNDTLSAVYLAGSKDRLYCEGAKSAKRRRTQTVMYDMVDALIKFCAPILVHSAEEAYLFLKHIPVDSPEAKEVSVHLEKFPSPPNPFADPLWNEAMELRHLALKEIENSKEKGITHPMDIGILAKVPSDQVDGIKKLAPDLVDLCGVSRFEVQEGGVMSVSVQDLREEPRCERSWKRDGTVKKRSDGGFLSDRDASVLGLS